MSNDFERLAIDQKGILLEALVNKSKGYGDENLCFSVGDMITRKYSVQVALDAFRRMWASGEKGSRFIAQFGACSIPFSAKARGGAPAHAAHQGAG